LQHEQQQVNEQAQASFTSKEAGDILKIAVRLGGDQVSQEQLEAIAEEAGLSREVVQQAIREYQRQQAGAVHEQTVIQKPRQTHRRRWGWLFLPVGLIWFILFMNFVVLRQSFIPTRTRAVIAPNATEASSLGPFGREIRQAGKNVQVWTENGPFGTEIFVAETGKSGRVLHSVQERVMDMVLSPGEERIAFFTSEGGIWVMNTDGSRLVQVSRVQEKDFILESENVNLVWGDDHTIAFMTLNGRMQAVLDKNNVPFKFESYTPKP